MKILLIPQILCTLFQTVLLSQFHSLLYLNKVAVLRSFTDSIEKLADVSFLADDMLRHRDPVTTSQLLGCVQNVSSKKNEYSLVEMFCCELKFVVDICKKWVYGKFMKSNLSLDLVTKTRFKNENKLCFDNPSVICGFELGTPKVHVQNQPSYLITTLQ